MNFIKEVLPPITTRDKSCIDAINVCRFTPSERTASWHPEEVTTLAVATSMLCPPCVLCLEDICSNRQAFCCFSLSLKRQALSIMRWWSQFKSHNCLPEKLLPLQLCPQYFHIKFILETLMQGHFVYLQTAQSVSIQGEKKGKTMAGQKIIWMGR